jgi:hypothetical protein
VFKERTIVEHLLESGGRKDVIVDAVFFVRRGSRVCMRSCREFRISLGSMFAERCLASARRCGDPIKSGIISALPPPLKMSG